MFAWNGHAHHLPFPPPFSLGIPPYELATTWVQTYLRTFDHLGAGMLTVFECSTTSLWLDAMYYGTDATGVDKQPIRDFDRTRCVFFVLIIIVCCFFMLNLFVGVTIERFVRLKEAAENKSLLLSDEQKQWVEIQSILMTCAPQVCNRRRQTGRYFEYPPHNIFRIRCS